MERIGLRRRALLAGGAGRIMQPMFPVHAFAARLAGALAVAALAAAPLRGANDPPAPLQRLDGRSNRVDYRIVATVQDADRHLSGEEWIRWENRSGEAVGDLWFHLYLNAFSNNRSTHLSEARGRLGGVEIEDGWGWQRVTGVWVRRGELPELDVFDTFRYEQPDDGNPEDKTVFAVDLPWPIASGEAVEIRVTWESRLPRLRRRTGVKGDFIFCAQWFPKLGVYEAGTEGGADAEPGAWNAHQFHMNTEFYSNYGTYDVTLDLPAKYAGKVGGSGVVERSVVEGERVITRFLAPSLDDRQREDTTGRQALVHDFAWTADPDFVEYVRTFRFREWAERYAKEVDAVASALARPRDAIIGRNVEVRVLMQPERAAQAERHFDATATALFFYGLWWGPYPYEQLTAVDPAWGGGAAGGMEYPTIFTCGTRLFTRPSMHSPEGVTVHECGHQFWYGLVGNNEFEAAWLDEGLNSYTDSEVLFLRYGEQVGTTTYARYPIDGVRIVPPPGGSALSGAMAGRLRIPFTDWRLSPLVHGDFVEAWRDQPLLTLSPSRTDPRWGDRTRYLEDPDRDPIDTCAYCYVDRRSYRTNSYPRPAVALRTLCGLIGTDAFLRGMRHFAETWRYRHPYPDDFYAAFVEGSGHDVHWYFDEVFRGTGTADWAVAVEPFREAEPAGLFQAEVGGEFRSRAATLPESERMAEATPKEGDDPEQVEEPALATPGDLAEGEPQGEPAEVSLAEAAAKSERPWRTRIVLTRHGSLALPIDWSITYERGDDQRGTWTREEQLARRWLVLEPDPGRKVVAVRLDPERRIYIDTDMSNNQWFDDSDRLAPLRWSERAFTQVSQYLHWMSKIGG